VRGGVVRRICKHALQAARGLVELVGTGVGLTERQQRGSILRPESQVPRKRGLRRSKVAHVVGRNSQVEMGFGKLRLQRDRLAEADQRFSLPALLQEGASEVGVGRGKVGRERQRLLEAGNCLVEATLILVGVAQVEVRFGDFRSQTQDCAIALDRFVDPALLLKQQSAPDVSL